MPVRTEPFLIVEHRVFTKVETLKIARALKLSTYDTVGRLVFAWSWFQRTADEGGLVRGADAETIDLLVDHEGFAAAMAQAGWLTLGDEGLSMPRFDRLTSPAARRAAREAERKARFEAQQRAGDARAVRGKRAADAPLLRDKSKREEEESLNPPKRGGDSSSSPPAGAHAEPATGTRERGQSEENRDEAEVPGAGAGSGASLAVGAAGPAPAPAPERAETQDPRHETQDGPSGTPPDSFAGGRWRGGPSPPTAEQRAEWVEAERRLRKIRETVADPAVVDDAAFEAMADQAAAERPHAALAIKRLREDGKPLRGSGLVLQVVYDVWLRDQAGMEVAR